MSMQRDETNREYWFIWTIANAVGVAVGVYLTETYGPVFPQITWLLFSVPIWLMRWLAWRNASIFKTFHWAELLLWITGELFGYLIGLGAQEGGGRWLTLGPIFGLFIGPQLWLWFRIMAYAHSYREKGFLQWFVLTFLFGFGGIFLSGLVFGFGGAMFTEILELTENYPPAFIYLTAGCAVGMLTGSIVAFSKIGLLNTFRPAATS